MEEGTGSGAGTRRGANAGQMRRMPTGMVVRGANGADARLRAVAEPGRGEGGKRAPRRAGGRAVGETLGEGRKRNAQAASVPPPREGEDRKRSLRSATQSVQRHAEGAQ